MRALNTNELALVVGGDECHDVAVQIEAMINYFYLAGCPDSNPAGCAEWAWQITMLQEWYGNNCL